MTKPLVGPSIMPALWNCLCMEARLDATGIFHSEVMQECFVPLADLRTAGSWDLDSVLGGLE